MVGQLVQEYNINVSNLTVLIGIRLSDMWNNNICVYSFSLVKNLGQFQKQARTPRWDIQFVVFLFTYLLF